MKPTPAPFVADLVSWQRPVPTLDTPQPADVLREIGILFVAHLAVAVAIVLVVVALVPPLL